MVEALNAKILGLKNLLRSKGLGDNAMVASLLIQHGLVQLTGDPSDRANRSAGPFICFQRGSVTPPDLWYVPADGSGPATQVATGAYFVTGL